METNGRLLQVGLLALTLVLGALALGPPAQAAPADLDPGFGQGGSERLFPSEEDDFIAAVAIQADDKIVLAGEADDKVLVARLLTDGSLDPSFGDGGMVVTPVGTLARASDVAIEPNGDIVVAGEAKAATNTEFMAMRYTPQGQLDPSFGTLDGLTTVPVGPGSSDATAVALGAEGRILLTGVAVPSAGQIEVGVVVLGADGKPYAGFGGGDGVSSFATTVPKKDYGVAIVEQSGGAVVVADAALSSGGIGEGFRLVRLTSVGQIDSDFGANGVVTTPIPADPGGQITDLAVLPDDRLLASGTGYAKVLGAEDASFAAARYLPDGKPDPSFGRGGSGVTTQQVGHGGDYASTALAAPNGRLVLAGSWEPGGVSSPAAIRLGPDGTLDPSFGEGGVLRRPMVAVDGNSVDGAALDSHERLMMVSSAREGRERSSVEVTRLLGDAAPPTPSPPSASSPPSVSQPPSGRGGRRPSVRIKAIPRSQTAARLKGFGGTLSDPDGQPVSRVEVSLEQKLPRGACRELTSAKGELARAKARTGKPCKRIWLAAKGTHRWSFALKGTLPPGSYTLEVRAVDSHGPASIAFSRAAGNLARFTLAAR